MARQLNGRFGSMAQLPRRSPLAAITTVTALTRAKITMNVFSGQRPDTDDEYKRSNSTPDETSSCPTDDIDGDDDIDEDQVAQQMSKMVKNHAGAVGKILMERSLLIESICWLAQHIPLCVLDDLLEDTSRSTENDEITFSPPLPFIECSTVVNPISMPELSDGHQKSQDQSVTEMTGQLAEQRIHNNRVAGVDDEKKSAKATVRVGQSSFLDPFADDSDDDSGNKIDNQRRSFLDPFPYDSDDERATQGRLLKRPMEQCVSSSKGCTPPSGHLTVGRMSCENQGDMCRSPMDLPHVSLHKCALLFVDISGFTKLSQILDVEDLSKVTSHGGDILKFVGDAIFVEWPVVEDASVPFPRNSFVNKDRRCRSLEECAAIAADCAATIVKTCSDFPIYASSRGGSNDIGARTEVGTLNVHCAIGVGNVAAVHLGDDTLTRKFLLVGDPIDQVSEAECIATFGEVAVSPETLKILSNLFDFDETLHISSNGRPVVIAARAERYFNVKDGLSYVSSLSEGGPINELKETLSLRCETLDTDKLRRLRSRLALYVHPVVVKDELSAEEHLRVDNTTRERHLAEAELRDVYTMFIMPLIAAELTGDNLRDQTLFQTLNKILLVVSRELENHGGYLSQFIIDDKGVVLMGNFGLRGSTFPNMISDHCLPCTTSIHKTLQVELNIDCHIGGTFGAAYCGVVGGIYRHEFTVLGPSVNLAARLMCNANNPGVLVDNSVRMKASKVFGFNALAPVKAKGYAEPVPIFEPLSAAEKRWRRANRGFVGRAKEISTICRLANDIANSPVSSKMIFVQADSGTGKSALMVQALSGIKKLAISARKEILITRNISNEGDRMIPFSMFRSIFRDALEEIQGPCSEDDWTAGKSVDRDVGESESLSCVSRSSSSVSLSSSLNRFLFLMKELDAPPEYLEIVGYRLLGIRNQSSSTFTENTWTSKPGMLDSIVDFLARAFLRCTCHADLVVMALDDVHLLDELSWKVIQALFKQGLNLLIISASRPLKSYKLEVDPAFWAELHHAYSRELRFSELYLSGLNEDDIRNLISKALGIAVGEIDSGFFLDFNAKSGGMPHFSLQMLEAIRKNDLVSKLENGSVGWRKDLLKDEMPDFNFATVGELIVYRIDSLDTSVRNALHLCAVLGPEFEVSDVIAVYQNWLQLDESEKNTHATAVIKALDVAAEEGIIEEVYAGGHLDEVDEDTNWMTMRRSSELSVQFIGDVQTTQDHTQLDYNVSYRFHHPMWQENILKLMLDTRKRDLHRIIADSLELGIMRSTTKGNDYYSMIKLFGHRRASGDTSKAASLALSIGKSYGGIGMNEEAVKIFDEALDLWRRGLDGHDFNEPSAGFPSQVIQHISVDDLQSIIQLQVEKGKSLSTLHKYDHSVQAYNDALWIMQQSPASADLKDRSITFALFSGLFVLLKFGKIEQDKDCTYEQEIVRRFVAETKLHGDPVHYSRALGMQAEVLARLGKVHEALEAVGRLSEIYNVEKHSLAVCKAYGTDRCAQVITLSILWHLQLGHESKALELCEFSLNEILPKMDITNVHNSMIFLWPIYSVLKERGQAKRMRQLLEDFVFQPFYKHYGEDGFTFCLPVYRPASILLEICEDGVIDGFDEKLDWVLQDRAGVYTDMFDNAMGNYGRTSTQITAEICLCLARRTVDPDKKRTLIAKGTALARLTSMLCKGDGDRPRMQFAFDSNKPVHDALETMAQEFGVTEEMMNQYSSFHE